MKPKTLIIWSLTIGFVLVVAASCASMLSALDTGSDSNGVQSSEPKTKSSPTSKGEEKDSEEIGTSFKDGTYLVGTDIAAGSYKTEGDSDFGVGCYWERAKDDSSEFGSIISNDYADGPSRVTIKTGEYFKASGGCTWVKQ